MTSCSRNTFLTGDSKGFHEFQGIPGDSRGFQGVVDGGENILKGER